MRLESCYDSNIRMIRASKKQPQSTCISDHEGPDLTCNASAGRKGRINSITCILRYFALTLDKVWWICFHASHWKSVAKSLSLAIVSLASCFLGMLWKEDECVMKYCDYVCKGNARQFQVFFCRKARVNIWNKVWKVSVLVMVVVLEHAFWDAAHWRAS